MAFATELGVQRPTTITRTKRKDPCVKPEVVMPPTPEGAGQLPIATAQSPAGQCGQADRQMLEGPHSRTGEFVTLLRVLRDFLRGFRVLHFVGPCVIAFG